QWKHALADIVSEIIMQRTGADVRTLPSTTKSTSRRPIPERYARNAASYPGPARSLRPVCWFQIQTTHAVVLGALQLISQGFWQLEGCAFHVRSGVWFRQPNSIFTCWRRPA